MIFQDATLLLFQRQVQMSRKNLLPTVSR